MNTIYNILHVVQSRNAKFIRSMSLKVSESNVRKKKHRVERTKET